MKRMFGRVAGVTGGSFNRERRIVEAVRARQFLRVSQATIRIGREIPKRTISCLAMRLSAMPDRSAVFRVPRGIRRTSGRVVFPPAVPAPASENLHKGGSHVADPAR